MCKKCNEVLAANPGATQLKCMDIKGDYAEVRLPTAAEIVTAAAMLMPSGTNMRAVLITAARGMMISDLEQREVFMTMLDIRLEAACADELILENLEDLFTEQEMAEIKAAVRAAIRRPENRADPRAN